MNVNILSEPQDVNIALDVLKLLLAMDEYIIIRSHKRVAPEMVNFHSQKIKGYVERIKNQATASKFSNVLNDLKSGLDGNLSDVYKTIKNKQLIDASQNTLFFFDRKSKECFVYQTRISNSRTIFMGRIAGKICTYSTTFYYLSLLSECYHYCHHFGKNIFCIYDADTDSEHICTKSFSFKRGLFFSATPNAVITNIPYTPKCLQTLIEHRLI